MVMCTSSGGLAWRSTASALSSGTRCLRTASPWSSATEHGPPPKTTRGQRLRPSSIPSVPPHHRTTYGFLRLLPPLASLAPGAAAGWASLRARLAGPAHYPD